jgi:chromosome segregation ATPase
MGIRETLQDALVNANNERIKWHSTVRDYDNVLVGLKADLQRAQTKKAGADSVHKTANEKYRELLAYSNGLTDQGARQALSSEVENLAQNVNSTIRNVQVAGEEARQQQRKVDEIETLRASAQISLTTATERWEQIKKQIEDLNH